jgi:hypothetical protein
MACGAISESLATAALSPRLGRAPAANEGRGIGGILLLNFTHENQHRTFPASWQENVVFQKRRSIAWSMTSAIERARFPVD